MLGPIPTLPRERHVWVLGQLKLRGESFASIGRRLGKTKNGVRKAMVEPCYEMEKAIAETLGLKVRELFPERYDARGRRLHLIRVRRPREAAHEAAA